MKKIEDFFAFKRSPDDFNRTAKNIYNQYKSDPLVVSIMLDIDRHNPLLLGWRKGAVRVNSGV